MTIESASPATRRILDLLRQDLDRFESYERKYYVAFRSERTGRVFAYLNPLKAHVRLFLLLESDEVVALRRGPSTTALREVVVSVLHRGREPVPEGGGTDHAVV